MQQVSGRSVTEITSDPVTVPTHGRRKNGSGERGAVPDGSPLKLRRQPGGPSRTAPRSPPPFWFSVPLPSLFSHLTFFDSPTAPIVHSSRIGTFHPPFTYAGRSQSRTSATG